MSGQFGKIGNLKLGWGSDKFTAPAFPPPPAGSSLLLVDNASFLLLVDGASKLTLAA